MEQRFPQNDDHQPHAATAGEADLTGSNDFSAAPVHVQKLIDGCNARDPEAAGRLFDRFLEYTLGWTLDQVPMVTDANETCWEVWASIFDKVTRRPYNFDGDEHFMKFWRACALRVIINNRRAQGGSHPLFEDIVASQQAEPHDIVQGDEDRQRLNAVFDVVERLHGCLHTLSEVGNCWQGPEPETVLAALRDASDMLAKCRGVASPVRRGHAPRADSVCTKLCSIKDVIARMTSRLHARSAGPH